MKKQKQISAPDVMLNIAKYQLRAELYRSSKEDLYAHARKSKKGRYMEQAIAMREKEVKNLKLLRKNIISYLAIVQNSIKSNSTITVIIEGEI